MSSKKHSDNSAAGRLAVDLERKKLEVELKAVEEIAKLQQTVIEKRLALELASLHDGNDHSQKFVLPQLNDERRPIEEVATRKQNLIDYSMPEDYSPVNRVQPARPPPPQKAPQSDGVTFPILKSESSSLSQVISEMNPLRSFIDKKLNVERRSPRMESSPTPSSSREYKHQQDYRRSKHTKNSYYPPPGMTQGPDRVSASNKARALWKVAMTKVKKIKSKHSGS